VGPQKADAFTQQTDGNSKTTALKKKKRGVLCCFEKGKKNEMPSGSKSGPIQEGHLTPR